MVKASDSKSDGIFPHRFEPCSQRYFLELFYDEDDDDDDDDDDDTNDDDDCDDNDNDDADDHAR